MARIKQSYTSGHHLPRCMCLSSIVIRVVSGITARSSGKIFHYAATQFWKHMFGDKIKYACMDKYVLCTLYLYCTYPYLYLLCGLNITNLHRLLNIVVQCYVQVHTDTIGLYESHSSSSVKKEMLYPYRVVNPCIL